MLWPPRSNLARSQWVGGPYSGIFAPPYSFRADLPAKIAPAAATQDRLRGPLAGLGPRRPPSPRQIDRPQRAAPRCPGIPVGIRARRATSHHGKAAPNTRTRPHAAISGPVRPATASDTSASGVDLMAAAWAMSIIGARPRCLGNFQRLEIPPQCACRCRPRLIEGRVGSGSRIASGPNSIAFAPSFIPNGIRSRRTHRTGASGACAPSIRPVGLSLGELTEWALPGPPRLASSPRR